MEAPKVNIFNVVARQELKQRAGATAEVRGEVKRTILKSGGWCHAKFICYQF